MAAKKYYAVKRGKRTGVFKSWEDCRNAVEGYPGAQYKGFAALEEANAYLGGSGADGIQASWEDQRASQEDQHASHGDQKASREDKQASNGDKQAPQEDKQASQGNKQETCEDRQASRQSRPTQVPVRKRKTGEIPAPGELLAYVDGSYDDSIKKYAFGCVFLLPDGRIYTEYGNGDNEKSLQHRNVTGEMLGAMYAVRFAMLNGFQGVEIRYDYQGIEKWVTGEWRSKTELTRKYAVSMREWGKDISIRFTKVAAHTNVTYNELADKMAKTGLTMGNGVPKIRRLEDMEEYDGTDEIK